MQDNLSLEDITINQAQILIKLRTRMANYGQHFIGKSQCQLYEAKTKHFSVKQTRKT